MRTVSWLPPEWHDTVGSTNVVAAADPRPGRVVVAAHQSAGRGRRGRDWTAPPGTALAVSAVVPAPPARLLGWTPLVAGLAVTRVLAAGPAPVPARVKWPNDVVVVDPGPQGAAATRGGKVCGVLAQVVEAPGGSQVVVVGTGLNVSQSAPELPVPTATSWLLARGRALPEGVRERFLSAYLDGLAVLLERLVTDPAGVRREYRAHCETLGRRVRIELPGGAQRTGTAVDVAEDGALVLRGDDGTVLAHHAGDVVHVRPPLG